MKSTKICTLTLTTILLASLTLSSIVAVTATTYHPNVNAGTTCVDPDYATYLSSEGSAVASASEYGDLIQPAYEWWDPWANNPERNGFNPGPAPDRPDVLWTSRDLNTGENPAVPKIILGSQTMSGGNFTNSVISSAGSGLIAFAGQLFGRGDLMLGNGTELDALISWDPHTGAVNWASIAGVGPTAGVGLGDSIFKVDDTHFAVKGGSVDIGWTSMWRIDGTFLWLDDTMDPNAVYRPAICVPAPDYLMIGPVKTSRSGSASALGPHLSCWTLADPEVDKGRTGRSLWNYTIDEAGDAPMMCYGDGLVYMGSYSSCTVFAVNITNGEKVWETSMPTASGYTGTYGDGKLFVGCQSMYVTCLDAKTGEITWQNDEGTWNRAMNVRNINYAYGRVYLHDLGVFDTGATKCFDAETGERLWASRTDMQIGYYCNVIGDGKLYGRQSDGSTTTGREDPLPTSFACWDAFTGEKVWELLEITEALPVLAYGCLYVRDSNVLICYSTAFDPEPWSMWRGNVENPGVTLDVGPTDLSSGPKWTYNTGGAILSSPVVADGKLYINSNDRYVYCLDAYNGTEIWKFQTKEPQMTTFGSTPAILGDRVFIGPDDGNMYCLNADTGAEEWSISMGTYRTALVGLGQHNIRCSPIIYNNRIYVGSIHNNKTYCISPSGQVIWSTELGGPMAGSMAIENDHIYIMTFDTMHSLGMPKLLYTLDMSGNILSSFEVLLAGTSFWSGIFGGSSYTPVVVGDQIWVGGTGDTFRCYYPNGTVRYEGVQPNVRGENSHGSCVYVSDSLLTAYNASGERFSQTGGKIIGQAGPTVACARADNGTNIWSDWGGWEVWSSVVFSGYGEDAVIYYGSESYGIHCIDAATGEPISWYTTGGNIQSSPAIWDGKLYIGSDDNIVYCFEDHPLDEMAISIDLDKTEVNVDEAESVTVTARLTGVNSLNPYVENQLGSFPDRTLSPPIPDVSVLVTFTKPDGVTEVSMIETTDDMGFASFSYTPDEAGTWKVITWYEGEDKPTHSYSYAFSDEILLNATVTPPPIVTSVSPMTLTVAVDESFLLTASVDGGTAPFTYQWYQTIDGVGVPISGETSSTLAPALDAPGTYGYYCEVTDAAGVVDSSDTAEIKVGTHAAAGIPLEYILAIVAVIVVIAIVVYYLFIKKRQ